MHLSSNMPFSRTKEKQVGHWTNLLRLYVIPGSTGDLLLLLVNALGLSFLRNNLQRRQAAVHPDNVSVTLGRIRFLEVIQMQLSSFLKL